jgi:UDP-galactopyranose mutase
MTYAYDLVCLSHLRWDFVFQRPQQVLSRCAEQHRVFFFEEPMLDAVAPWLEVRRPQRGVWVAVPHLPVGLEPAEAQAAQQHLLVQLLVEHEVHTYVLWYYTPMAMPFTRHLTPLASVYDCMDELSLFRGAPPELREYESELFDRADLVFTGGQALYEAKRERHPHVYAFPSSVDRAHFSLARTSRAEPADQARIPRPRLGFYGVVDERMDLELLATVAEARPEWQLVLVGPTAKIAAADLPRQPNIHYLGLKSYEDLPAYLAGWDVALLPFALNDSTRLISPTKTPEYLAAGKPVVSTPIRDVVRPYGDNGLVRIAATADEFVAAVEAALSEPLAPHRERVDAFLADMSWARTWARMAELMAGAIATRPRAVPAPAASAAVPAPKAQRSVSRPLATPRPIEVFDYLIVGAGFAGSVLAERLASQAGQRVLLLDRRPHFGGNAYDHHDDAGVLVHKYGPHIFHTNSERVFEYLSQFTRWRPYEHRVLASVDGQLLPIPINLDTVNRLYGLNLTPDGLAAFLAERAEPRAAIRTSEDVVVSTVGRELYEKFFRGYTRKQWGLDPSELDAAVTARVPTRTNQDDRYFTDTYQAMPLHGYTRLFENMLAHPNIKVLLNTDYREVQDLIPYRQLIFTGPVDEYFEYRYGKLPYRSLEFRFHTIDRPQVQPVAVVNHPNEHPYTRVTEFKHLTGQELPRTTLVYEYPRAEGDPYYPVPRPENAALYRRYKELADATPGVHFVGRLATYKYYNMDQVVAQALTLFDRLVGRPTTPQETTLEPAPRIATPDRAVGGARMHG